LSQNGTIKTAFIWTPITVARLPKTRGHQSPAQARFPGFGPALKEKLMDWRQSIEQRFRFDASRGVDPRDIANLNKEVADQPRKLEP
jgi:hypothetical protein